MSAHAHGAPSALRWLRKNLFSTPANSLLTVVTLVLLAAGIAAVVDWVVLDARWTGASAGSCRNVQGACWPLIWAHLDQFMYGSFPVDERWRIHVGMSLGVALAVLASLRFVPQRRLFGIALFTAYPLIAAVTGPILTFAPPAFFGAYNKNWPLPRSMVRGPSPTLKIVCSPSVIVWSLKVSSLRDWTPV